MILEEERLKVLTDQVDRNLENWKTVFPVSDDLFRFRQLTLEVLPEKTSQFELVKLQISNLLKLLYPVQNVGLTMGKILQLLLSSPEFQITYNNFEKVISFISIPNRPIISYR